MAGRDGIGLELDEAMCLAARSQSIVAAEHMQEVVSAHRACAVCRRELACNGGASIGHRTTLSNLRVADSRLDSKCRCSARAGASDSFNPLATFLEERTHPNCCAFKPARAAFCHIGGSPGFYKTSCQSKRRRATPRSKSRHAKWVPNWRGTNTGLEGTTPTATGCARACPSRPTPCSGAWFRSSGDSGTAAQPIASKGSRAFCRCPLMYWNAG